MSNSKHVLIVEGNEIQLRVLDNIRAVTPSREEHPARVASRLARSSRLALDSIYPHDSLVVWGEKRKIEELASYPDIENTRSAFHDPDGKLLVLTNDILIAFVDESTDDDRGALLKRLEGRVVDRQDAVWRFRVNDPAEDAPLLLARELSAESIVRYAEPNALQALTFHRLAQSELQLENQWHLQNTGQNGGVAGADIDALGAWKITRGSSGVSVVVHDCGVDVNHPALAANIDPGWNFDSGEADPLNMHDAHGTACAGLIAAISEGEGVTGIAPGCRIVPLKAAGAHTWQQWADTFDWAAEHGQIIACSWSVTPNNTLSAAIRRAVAKGVTVFCATGNGSPLVQGVGYPASMPETIGVGASTNADVRASYSQFGTGVDLVAPSSGGTLRIETIDLQGPNGYNRAASPAGDYCRASDSTGFFGTSAATSLAAGVGALILSVNPELRPEQVRQVLRDTSDKTDATNANYDLDGWNEQYGYGRINAARALERARELLVVCGDGTSDLIVRDNNAELRFYPFLHGTFQNHFGGKRVGHGFHYTHYFVGNWTGDGTDDLLVRAENGDMLLYPFEKSTFYGHGGGAKVAHGFNFTHYFVGNWTGNGTDDLIVRTQNGDLLLYPFRDGTFYGHGGGAKVGHGFDYTHYLVGNWTGSGTDDLIVRTQNGDMLFYPFRDGRFPEHRDAAKVAHGFNFTHYLVGNWTGDGTDDLIVRTQNGDMLLYPFEKCTFYGHGGGAWAGHGFDYTHYFVGNWTGSSTDDLIVRTHGGDLLLYPFRDGTFYGQGGGTKVGEGFQFTHYFPGKWL